MSLVLEKYYDKKILETACRLYNIDAEKAKLIRSNSNLIFDCGDQILRMSHSSIRAIEEIEIELDWMLFLKSKALPVVAIIQSNTGANSERINKGTDHFTIVCFKKIIGAKISKATWNETHFKKLGKLLGLLHKNGQGYLERAELSYLHWDEIVEHRAYENLPKDNRNLIPLYEKLTTEFKQYPKNKKNYSLIHYDVHHGNYLFDEEGELVLFDFEMVCKSWFVNDVATVLYYAAHVPSDLEVEVFEEHFLHHFWQGYEQEYKIAASEKKWIPKFLLYRDLLVYGFVGKVWSGRALSESENKYRKKLADSIERRRRRLGL